MLSTYSVLLPVLAALFLAPTITVAQDKTVADYPMWVTNDYSCVIGCLQVFNDGVTDRPSSDTELKATQCITDSCNKDSMGMNIYQAHYIIQMFYATGSIYEDANMGDWGQGTPPDLQVGASSPEEEGIAGAAPTSAEGEATIVSSPSMNGVSSTLQATDQPTASLGTSGSSPLPSSSALQPSNNATGANSSEQPGETGAAGRSVATGGWLTVIITAAAVIGSIGILL